MSAPNRVGDLVSQIQLFRMLVSQFHSKRWTTSIEGKPILCCFYPEIRPADPSGFELVTVLWSFYSENLFRSLFKSSVVLAFIFKEDHRESNVSSKPFVSEKWLIRSFFVIIRPGFEPALFSSLFVAVKETRASGSSFCSWKSQSFDAFLCRIDALLSFSRELLQSSAFNWKSFYKPLLRARWLNRSSRVWRSRVQSPAHFLIKTIPPL